MARSKSVDLSTLNLPAGLSTTRPLGEQIRELLEALARQLGPGATMPSDRQLAEHFGVARMTVRSEVKRLEVDGVVEVIPGSGTFVARMPRLAIEWGTSYTLGARAAGTPSTVLLQSTSGYADIDTAHLLRITTGAPVLTLTRLRALDGRPIGIEHVSLPLERFPGLDEVDLGNVSLYEVLAERWGLERASSTGRAAATLPSESDASLLGLTRRDPCMVVHMTSIDAAGEVFETGRSLYRADRYEVGIDIVHSDGPQGRVGIVPA